VTLGAHGATVTLTDQFCVTPLLSTYEPDRVVVPEPEIAYVIWPLVGDDCCCMSGVIAMTDWFELDTFDESTPYVGGDVFV